MVDLKVRRDVYGHTVMLGIPSRTIVPAELHVSLSWATPHTTWPQHMGTNPRFRMETSIHRNDEYRGIRKHSSQSRSSFSNHGEHNVVGSNKEDNGSDGIHPNLAIAFESLYGRTYLSHVLCPRVEALLTVGAYAHRYTHYHHPLE